jgi:cytoskeletal protein CcmA (bactofilin family)
MKDLVAQAGNFVRSFIHRLGSEKTPTPTISEQSFDLTVNEKQQSIVAEAVAIVGQLNCQDDLSLEGQFKGSIQAAEYTVVIGSNGLADGDITAKNLLVKGKVVGEIRVADRIIIAKTGTIVGNLQAARVELENGAKYKGIIEIDPIEQEATATDSASDTSIEESVSSVSAASAASAMEPS